MYLIWVGMKSWFFCLFLPLLRQSEEAAEAVSQVVVGVVDVLFDGVDGDVVLGGDFFLRLPFQAGGVDAAAGGGQFLKGVIDHLVDFGLDYTGADVVLQRFAREHLAVGKFLFDRLTFDVVEEGIVEGAEQVGLEDGLVAECLPTLPQAEPHVLQGVGYDLLVRHIVHAEVFQLAVILLVEMPELLAVRQDDSFPLSR